MEVSFEDQIKYLQQAIKSDDAEEVYKIAYDLLNSHPDDS